MSAAAASVTSRVWPRALAWLAFLGPFFFLTYGLANAWAAVRPNVPSIVFEWEHAIPFCAWTIVPYWTIDVLYAASLFLCASRHEVDVHGRRLLTAQLVAITCFVAAPLRFSFTVPGSDGVFGGLFAALGAFDQPFNQLPSLHVALAIIVWDVYARHLSGVMRMAVGAWFVLICVSVLTTYQHHFIDIPTGALLGLLCMWLWPWRGRSVAQCFHWTREAAHWRIAALYAGGAALTSFFALQMGGWALWLLWPGIALLLVALAYAAIGAETFQKSAAGDLSIAARWLLAPYLLGARINAHAWTWRDRDALKVAEGVHIGPLPTKAELDDSAFTAIVDVTAELASPRCNATLVTIPMLDLVKPDTDALLRAARSIETLRHRGPVLVCCALGCSRSACAVAAWLLVTGRERDAAAALSRVRSLQRKVVLHTGHAMALDSLRMHAGALRTEPT